MTHRPATARRLLLSALLIGLASCGSTGSRSTAPTEDPGAELQGSEVDLPTRPELLEIKRYEVARSTGGGVLQSFLTHADPVLRTASARALGRMPFPRYGDSVTVPLCNATSDPDRAVRREAAFALGIRGDVGARGVLTATANDADPSVRAKVIEALTRLGSENTIETALRALDDPSAAVRQEAIVGLARWGRDEPRAAEIDARLVAMLSPRRTEDLPASERWLVLYALQRRRAPAGAGAFLDHYQPRFGADTTELQQNVNARLYAVRGLARLDPTGERDGSKPRPELTRALERALEDVDWRIVVEAAVGLGAHGDPTSIEPLRKQLDHESPHVRRAVIQALGSFAGASRAVADALARGLSDASLGVRAETLVSITRVLPANDALVTLQQMRNDGEEVVRAGVARAAGTGLLPESAALDLLDPLLADVRTLVSLEAIRSLGNLGAGAVEGADERLRKTLGEHPDLVLVQGAADALSPRAGAPDLDVVMDRLSGVTGDAAGELWNTALKMAEGVRGAGAIELARRAETHPNPYIRVRATEVLAGLGQAPMEGPPRQDARPAEIPLPGREYPLWRTNPIVAIDTNRGSMYFELYPETAPMHVYNLLSLAETGYYDGTRFHRVELDFVIQGGDVRGDGAGGVSWRGDAL
ncbi:MAG: HEAT repeat domain-containing protein, partial [Planctomycetota bacterium]